MEALVPAGGGPPPHIHTREDETYYVLAGEIEVLLGEETVVAGPNDFVNIPRGTVHCFRNTGTETARMVLTFTPAGIEGWFEECLERAPNEVQEAPDNVDEVVARYIAAAPDTVWSSSDGSRTPDRPAERCRVAGAENNNRASSPSAVAALRNTLRARGLAISGSDTPGVRPCVLGAMAAVRMAAPAGVNDALRCPLYTSHVVRSATA